VPKELTRVDPAELVERLAQRPAADGTDERILTAAAQMLLVEGLSGLEVDQVADRSGVGRSTVYRRFGDRNGLIAAALAHEGGRFLAVLASAVADVEGLVDEVTAAFCAGLRLARVSGLAELVRSDPLLLRLLTVDSASVVAAARDQLVALASRRDPTIDRRAAACDAEVLVRLAISFVLNPSSALDLEGDGCEPSIRRHVAALVVAR
jgi:AcrR family transcriptional regulator